VDFLRSCLNKASPIFAQSGHTTFESTLFANFGGKIDTSYQLSLRTLGEKIQRGKPTLQILAGKLKPRG
jgi:hypothetical protein